MPAASAAPLASKLLLKAGMRVGVTGMPRGYEVPLDRLPDGARVDVDANGRDLDALLLFVEDQEALDRDLPPAAERVADGGLFWVAYRKGKKDFHRDSLREAVEAHGWTGVALVSVDDDWSAMRIRPSAGT